MNILRSSVFLGMLLIGKLKVSKKFIRTSAQMFLIIFTITIEDLYFTEYFPVSAYLNFHKFAEDVLVKK